jgi:starch-binding outer membrane protein, SusD/RagB family
MMIMKTLRYIQYILMAMGFVFTACQIDEVLDPNNPSLEGVLSNASKAELQGLVTGLEARHRQYFENATEMFGSFSREVSPFFASDPRFFSDWLGQSGPDTYPDFFASDGTYLSPYTAVKQANVLIGSVANTNVLSAAEANGYTGFAKTIKAYQLLWPLMQQYQNGIRTQVEDPLNPGPIRTFDQALSDIRALLDEGRQDLQNAGATFGFTLRMGFGTPADMIKVNRAIAARVALYDEDWAGALTALDESFLDLDVTSTTASKMYIGPVHVFGNDPDVSNPLFYPLEAITNTILIVHPDMIEDLLPGDARGAKFYKRNEAVENDDFAFPGDYQDNRWATNTLPIPFIRNEELILIYAEAQVRSGNLPEAVDAINIVRNTWRLTIYIGSPAPDALIEEILFQRRYSLWAEAGHRWIDLRRTGKLDPAHVDLRDGGSIIVQVDRPTSETNWEERE